MKALVFGVEPDGWQAPDDAPPLGRSLASSPVALLEVPDARPLRPDWLVTRLRTPVPLRVTVGDNQFQVGPDGEPALALTTTWSDPSPPTL